MSQNDLNMTNLFITHLTHPWGPPWTLETLGDPWRLAWKWPFCGKLGGLLLPLETPCCCALKPLDFPQFFLPLPLAKSFLEEAKTVEKINWSQISQANAKFSPSHAPPRRFFPCPAHCHHLADRNDDMISCSSLQVQQRRPPGGRMGYKVSI